MQAIIIIMKHVKEILQAAGVEPIVPADSGSKSNEKHDHGDNDDDAILEKTMEVWLGLSSSAGDDASIMMTMVMDDTEATTVEDCLPLAPSVYRAAVAWLVEAWTGGNNNHGGGGTSLVPMTMNPFLEFSSKFTRDSDIHLERAFVSVRATRWVRAWMEFNLNDPTSSDATEEISLWSQLLQVDGATASNTNDNDNNKQQQHPKNALVRALFQHIQDLPVLQQQLQTYSQHLQRTDPHSMLSSSKSASAAGSGGTTSNNNDSSSAGGDGGGSSSSSSSSSLKDPTSRLRQYERALTIANRLQDEWQQHLDRLQCILGEVYLQGNADQRRLCRRLLGHVWSQFVLLQGGSGGTAASVRQENTKAAAIRLTLQVLRRILLGSVMALNKKDDDDSNNNVKSATVELPEPLEHLLFHQLIPLHKADGMVLWRDQTAVLELYHEPLCQCMAILLQQNVRKLIPPTIQQLLHRSIFPIAGNTPKQVLLLHEIDTYIRLLVPMDKDSEKNGIDDGEPTDLQQETAMMRALYQALARCMSSEHSRVAERALQFFQNKSFEHLVQHRHLDTGLRIILPALVRREPSWNPTVRKMTYNVLKKMQEYNEEAFVTACTSMFSSIAEIEPEKDVLLDSSKSAIVASQTAEAAATRSMAPTTKDFSLKAGMGTWRPPGAASASAGPPSSRSMPPPTARPPSSIRPTPSAKIPPGKGAAPWAMNPPTSRPQQQQASGPRTAATPPLTITGVAPWAMQQQPAVTSPGRYKRGANGAPLGALEEKGSNDDDASSTSSMSVDDEVVGERPSGLAHVLAYMKSIQPPEEEEGFSSWSRAQMAETPTYLPKLKFHGLVFGHDLGTGAFGSVKYARLIDKNKARSQWPEYAVKVVSTEKIQELGYEASIQREIAVLRVLSHPGIARLVSSFRFHDGAYLVLEYASRGDLHTLLQKHGSLDLDSTRFLVGEVVAALASMHDLGFVYADLKPENIVITEPGHVKLTDFGGCRPVTAEAKAMVKKYAKDILKNLRDGDWKQRPQQASISGYESAASMEDVETHGSSHGDKINESEDDLRVEGTTAYLPPEVVLGSFPTFAADSWALGCVMFQCLSGRPPLLEADDEATKNRIVSFDVKEAAAGETKTEIDMLFEDHHASGIPTEAREVIKSLLDRNPTKRLSMNQLAESDFFTSDVFSLYTQPAYPLDVGSVSPAPNSNWARRQFSSIWAPQPEAYNVSLPDEPIANDTRFPGTFSDTPIPEGEERSGFYTSSGSLPTAAAESMGKLARARKMMPLPPTET